MREIHVLLKSKALTPNLTSLFHITKNCFHKSRVIDLDAIFVISFDEIPVFEY